MNNVEVKIMIKYINEINQIMKAVYNSNDLHENIWKCKNGKFYMYHQKQFPSFIEVEVSSETLVTAKGAKTKAGKDLDAFLEYVSDKEFTVDSVKFFTFLKEYKSSITTVYVNDSNELIMECEDDNTYINKNISMRDIELYDSNYMLDRTLIPEMVSSILEFGNTPFEMVFDFDNELVGLDLDISNLESYLNFKINKKFIPALKSTKDLISTLSVVLYETGIESMYDIQFIVKNKNYTIKSIIRILEN